MNKRNIAFVELALGYFMLGGLAGLLWLWQPNWLPGQILRIHGHMMLIGFVSMMIFGIALHVLPRFSGRPLYSDKLADAQFWAVNLGLWLMCLGWWLGSSLILAVGGVLEVVGYGLFGYNLARTMMGYQPVPREGLEAKLTNREARP